MKIEMWPMGFEDKAYPLGEIRIDNITDIDKMLSKRGWTQFHDYRVRQLSKKGKVVRKAQVLDHPRSAVSIFKLVDKALHSLGHIT